MNVQVLRGLPKKLVSSGLMDEALALELTETSAQQKVNFVKLLVDEEVLDPGIIASISSEEFGLPLYNIDAHNFATSPKELINSDLITKHCALPLVKKNNNLFVALSDPTNQFALTELRFQAGCQVSPVLVEHDKLVAAIENFLNESDTSLEDAFGDIDEASLDGLDLEQVTEADDNLEDPDNDAPIVKYVNKLLLDAIKKGASDIHFEPYEKSFQVPYLTNHNDIGVLAEECA